MDLHGIIMMKKTFLSAALLLASCSVFAAEQPVHWDYEGEAGPANWAKLSPEFGACAGKNQTPINLTGFIRAELKPLMFHYVAGGTSVINNGHTIQVNYAPGSAVMLDGVSYELKQFHFHAPSENEINGTQFPLEGHFVHADKDGHLLVIAVMFKEGKENKAMDQVWKQLPQHAKDTVDLAPAFDAMSLLPKNRSYYRFNGSLTTPPCSEGVRWFVMKKPVSVSKAQIDAFKTVMGHDNNRPLQPVNARTILE